MSIFVPIDHYRTILEETGRWKAVGVKDLYENLKLNLSYSLFCRKIRRLEKENMLRCFTGMRRRKYITLTKEGESFIPYNAQYDISEAEVNHDLITSTVLSSLNKLSNFSGGHVVHHDNFFKSQADGLIYARKKGVEYSIAIEVELTQKSKVRILEKFRNYKDSEAYNYVIFIFNKRSAFLTYQNQLNQMIEEVRRKVFLLLDEKLSINQFHYNNSEIRYLEKDYIFEKLFPEKTVN
jgi:predicted transcriptional regulator